MNKWQYSIAYIKYRLFGRLPKSHTKWFIDKQREKVNELGKLLSYHLKMTSKTQDIKTFH